jgi:glycosyltransferase involved in cell wall biosynthesis
VNALLRPETTMDESSSSKSTPLLEVVLPVHNEADSIAATLTELHDVWANELGFPLRFIVCEDGSTDNSVQVLTQLQQALPLRLISDPYRKNYSRAVVDGFRATSAPFVAFIDSDGQCDPRDFARFWPFRDQYDLIVGYRNPRCDHWVRILMSRAFGRAYRLFFDVPLRDPSCPYLLVNQEAMKVILRGTPGILEQGFWWEFMARASSAGLTIHELPVAHRVRAAGQTQVYRPTKVISIGLRHLRALFRLRRQLNELDGA